MLCANRKEVIVKKKKPTKKKKVKTCNCGRPWDYGMCPDCRAYQEAVDRAKAHDRDLYNEWLWCRCGAFNRNLERIRRHASSCPSGRARRTS